MKDLRLTRRAKQDLAQIERSTIETWGADQGTIYLDALRASIFRMLRFPESGAAFDHPISGLRRHVIASHVAFYRSDANGVLVLRVLHGAMDPARRLRVKE